MFFLASLVGVVFLYLVGFLILKGFKFSNLFALAAAPIVSTLCFEILAIVFDKLNHAASWVVFFVPSLLLGAVVCGIGVLYGRRQGQTQKNAVAASELKNSSRFDLKMVVLYVGLALFVGLFVFVKALDGPACFNETYDNLTHLGLVQSFLESGHYSALAASVYQDLGEVGSYYPAAWHLITAMVAGATGTSNLVATNAMNYVCCCVVYPLSCLCLMRQIFSRRNRVVVAGAFAAIGFVSFPWFFTVYGVLESNLFGFIMVPVMLAAIMQLFGSEVSRADRARYLSISFVSALFCVFAQPNAFFAVMLFAVPYLVWRIWDSTGQKSKRPRSTKVRAGSVALFLLVVFVVWAICYKAPFLYAVTHFIWPPATNPSQAFINTLLFSNSWAPVSLVVAVLVGVGLYAMWRERKYGWLATALVITAAIYWVSICLEGAIDQFLSGFWYSDWRRTAALQAMIAVPVAALGIAHLYGLIARHAKLNLFSNIGLALLLIVFLFMPNFLLRGIIQVQTPFGYFDEMMYQYYSMDQGDDEVIFSESERKFVTQVKEIVGDKVVYNLPYDGSFFAYQSDGLHTIYRLPYTGPGQNADQQILQSSLYEYSSNKDVQQAVDNLGAEYVLTLDYGHIPHHKNSPDPYAKSWPDYLPENWTGITRITEDTPGFELVLSEGDMRLYKIVELS